jgi:peptide/nickel transport system substrate-binding protein
MRHTRVGTISRRNMIKGASALSIATVGGGLSVFHGAHGLAQGNAVQRGGVLTVAIPEDTDSIDPAKGGNLGFGIIGPLMGQPLVGGNPADEIVPVLAESYSSPDEGRTWVFNLRQGVKFHNGLDLTAEVVKWNYDRFLSEDSEARVGPMLRAMGANPSVVDEYTFQVELESGFGSFPSQLAQNSWTCILAPESFNEDGTINTPISTGPFMLESYTPGSELRFQRFDDYWQIGEDSEPLPYLDGLVINIVPEASVRLSALRAGDVNLITHTPLEDVREWADGGAPEGLDFRQYFYNYSDVFSLNALRAPFEDERARQAVQFTIDRQELNELVYAGLAQIHNQPFKTDSIWYLDVPTPEPDLDRARALMEEAGLEGGVDVTYIVWSPQYDSIAEVIQAQLSQIGIRVALDKGDFASWAEKGRAYEYDMLQHPFGTLFHPDQSYQRLGSTSDRRWQAGGLEDPEYDRLLQEGRNTFEFTEAQEIYTELVELFQTRAHLNFLMNAPLVHSYTSGLTDYEPIDQGIMALAATNGVHLAWLVQ